MAKSESLVDKKTHFFLEYELFDKLTNKGFVIFGKFLDEFFEMKKINPFNIITEIERCK